MNPLTPYEMVKTYTPNLSAMQRKANIDYFTMMLNHLKEGGTYVWPDLGKTFTKVGNGFVEVK